ncbi:hypothetical protein SEA_LEWANDO_85 [Arthrobacter phage Lewando]|nr:hypothetical protein SEA_LEWANDO_85 [Arthrobacter phage Lewando]
MSLDIDPNDPSLHGVKGMKWGAKPPTIRKGETYRVIDPRPHKKRKVVTTISNPDHYGWLRNLEAEGGLVQKRLVDGSWVDVSAPEDVPISAH